jgi:hypothetical protein
MTTNGDLGRDYEGGSHCDFSSQSGQPFARYRHTKLSDIKHLVARPSEYFAKFEVLAAVVMKILSFGI